MSQILGILFGIAAMATMALASYRLGFEEGRDKGYGEGYQRGSQDSIQAFKDWQRVPQSIPIGEERQP